MLLRAGEVLERRTPRRKRHHPEVDLQAGPRPDRGLLVAAHDHLGDEGQLGERRHQRAGVVSGGEDVDVADGLPHPPQRAGVGAPQTPGYGRQRTDDLLRRGHRGVDLNPPGLSPGQLYAVEQVLGRLRAEPAQPCQPALGDRLFQGGDRVDAQLLVEHHRLARAEAGHDSHRPDSGWDLRSHLLDRRHGTRLEKLDDLLRDGRAYARDRLQRLGVHRRHVAVMPGNRPSGLFVRPRPERVASGDREEVGVLLEETRDRVIRPRHWLSLRTGHGEPRRDQLPGLSAGR